MKIKPDERPRAIALVLGIVLVLCMFGFTVVPRLLPHSPTGQLLLGSASQETPSTSTSPNSTPVRQVPPTPAGKALPLITAAVVPLQTPSTTSTDPFWRPLALSLLPNRSTFVPARPPVPGLSTNAKSGFQLSAGPMKLAVIAPPPLPEVELQGIVQDETAMAVLAVGGQARFLKAGETLEGGWVVWSIQTSAVVLRQGRREVLLTLGQTHLKEAHQENRDVRGLAATLPSFHTVTLQP